MGGRWTPTVSVLAAFAGCRAPDSTGSGSTSGTSTETSTGVPEDPELPADCRESEDRGPYPLPDAVIGAPYDVDLLDWQYGVVLGVGVRVEGDVPPGLEVTLTNHVTGIPTMTGTYELAAVSGEHSVPFGCPGVTYRTDFTLAVLDGASTTTGAHESSTGEDGGSSSGAGE